MGADGLAGLDFEAVETAAKRLALRIMGQVLAGRLNADRSDQQGSQQPCDCGGVARYAGRRPKTFTTALGEMELERAWYHCQRCHTGRTKDRTQTPSETLIREDREGGYRTV